MVLHDDVVIVGSGRASRLGVAAKAAMLDRAAVAGLPVPPGLIVVPSADAGVVVVPPALGPRLAVRSAFGSEDGTDTSLAGHFLTELDVRPDDVAASIDRVRASAGPDPTMRTDVLVMRAIDPVVAGVAFSEDGYEDDLVNAAGGRGDHLLSGLEPGQRFRLARLRRGERPDPRLAPWQRRLAVLVRAVRRAFGPGDWDIEWTDDGATCWLVQVRPVTAAPARDEAFTIANHKEILPELPSTFMTSLIESAAHDLLDFYASLDADLPVHRPFVETFAGRPYLNLSMLTDLMRALGLPTRLVTDSYGGTPDVDVGLAPRRVVASARTLARIGLAQLGAVGRADRVAEQLRATAVAADADVAECIAVLRASYLALVNEMGALASSLAPPVALLRATGTLDEHLARQRTAATRMLDDLEPIAALLADQPDPAVQEANDLGEHWQEWLVRHGHRGVFESDIARPRFADDPSPILDALRHGRRQTPTSTRRSAAATATLPLWMLARAPMTAREQVRSAGMEAFAAIRTRLVALASAAMAAGQLPDPEALWLLTLDEARSLDSGAVFSAAAIDARRRERTRLAAVRLPDTLHRFDDLDALTAATPTARSFRGLPLVRGRIDGIALRATEPPSRLPDGFDPATTVLVARSVDAGWIGTFTQVAGVAVEIGGDLSHGSIILRELGVVSVTNLGEVGDAIATGDTVSLDADTGRLVMNDAPPAQTGPKTPRTVATT